MSGPRVIGLAEALARLPLPATEKWPDGTWYDTLLDQPHLQLLVFAPQGQDYQSPHDRDELYIAVAGSAVLEMGDAMKPFTAGDVAWVPKGESHRFSAISPEFAAWVVFVS